MTTKTKRRRWTAEDLGIAGSTFDVPAREVAEAHGWKLRDVYDLRNKVRGGSGPGNNTWTDAEIGFVQDNPKMSARLIGIHLGRGQSSVERTRYKLEEGWSPQESQWTPEEDELLRSLTGKKTAAQLSELLPGRAKSAIHARRHILGLDARSTRWDNAAYAPAGRTVLARTCSKCGVLTSGGMFRDITVRGKQTTRSTCRFCDGEMRDEWKAKNPDSDKAHRDKRKGKFSQWKARIQEVTRQSATRHGFPWLDADLVVLADPEKSNLSKALQLGRTYNSVTSACSNRGYTSKAYSLGARSDSAWIIHNPNADRVDEITAALKQEFATAGVQFPEWDWDD